MRLRRKTLLLVPAIALVACFSLSVADLIAQTRVVGGIEVTGEVPAVSYESARPVQPNWGTSIEAVELLHAMNFTPSSSSQTWDTNQLNLFRTGGGTLFDANVNLPAGAEITRFEIEGCDSSPTAHIQAYLFRFASPGNTGILLANVATTDAGTPGCTFVGVSVTAPERFVDKLLYRYNARIAINGIDATTRVGAVRVYYKLQVSPAPATATFTDVPTTHVFFQYVEALYASGITAGCGAGTFCPDTPVTRGQMAVFLARALGLHFPN